MERYGHDSGDFRRRRIRKPGTDERIIARIQLLRIGGKSLGEIEGQLAKEVVTEGPLFGLPQPAPRTISKYARQVSPPDPSGEWSMLDEDEEDAALILPVLGELLTMDRGLRLTNAEADLLVRIGRATDRRLSGIERLRFARLYLAAKADKADTREVDRELASWPGESLAELLDDYYRRGDTSKSWDRARERGELYQAPPRRKRRKQTDG